MLLRIQPNGGEPLSPLNGFPLFKLNESIDGPLTFVASRSLGVDEHLGPDFIEKLTGTEVIISLLPIDVKPQQQGPPIPQRAPRTWRAFIDRVDVGVIGSDRQLIISGGGVLYLLGQRGHVRCAENALLSDIVRSLTAGAYQAGGAEEVRLPWVMQRGENDADFLRRICRQTGFLCYYDGKIVRLRPEKEDNGNNAPTMPNVTILDLEAEASPQTTTLQGYSAVSGAITQTSQTPESDLSLYGKITEKSNHLFPADATYLPDPNHLQGRAAEIAALRARDLVMAVGQSTYHRIMLAKAYGLLTRRTEDNKPMLEYFRITSLQHSYQGGLYEVNFEAIPADLPLLPQPGPAPGPMYFVGEVTDNEDEQKCGRVRVRLFSGGNAISPWLTVLRTSETIHHVPAKGTLVMVRHQGGSDDAMIVEGTFYHHEAQNTVANSVTVVKQGNSILTLTNNEATLEGTKILTSSLGDTVIDAGGFLDLLPPN